MGKIIKWVAVIVAVPVILFAVVAIIFLSVDIDHFKQQIADSVHQQTGRQLKLEGELEKTVFPWLGLRIGKLSLGNPVDFLAPQASPQQSFANIGKLDVRLKLLPLFSKRIEIDTVTVYGLQVHLQRNATGQNNWQQWEMMANGDTPSKATKDAANEPSVDPSLPQEPSSTLSSSGQASVLTGLVVAGVDIKDAKLVWDDQQQKQYFELHQFNLKANQLGLGQWTQHQLSMHFKGENPNVAGHLDWQANVRASAEQQISLKDGTLTFQLDKSPWLKPSLSAQLNTQMDVDLQQQTLALKQFDLRAQGLRFQLKMDIEQLLQEVLLKGDVKFNVEQKEKAQAWLKSIVPSNEIAALLPGLSLTSDIRYQMAKDSADVQNLHLTTAWMETNAQLGVTQLSKQMQFSGQLSSSEFVPRQVLKDLAIELPDNMPKKALQKAKIEFSFNGNANQVNARAIDILLDNTRLKGKVGINDFAKQALRYDLHIDKLNVDHYLPVSDDKKAAVVSTPAAAATPAAQLPMELLRTLNIDGDLQVGALTVAKVKVQSLVSHLAAANGEIRLHPFKVQLYDGHYQGDILLDATAKQPVIEVNETLKQVNVGTLLKDAVESDKLKGLLDLEAKLHTSGHQFDQWMASLNGTAQLKFHDAEIKGVDLAGMIQKAYSTIRGKPLQETAAKNSHFSAATASLQVQNGIVTNKDLVAKAPGLRVTGNGTVDLPKQNVNYSLQATLAKTAQGQGGKEAQELKGVSVPIKVKGPFSNLKIGVDSKALKDGLKAKMRKSVKRRVTKKKQKLKTKTEQKKKELKKKLNEKLKGFFR